MRWDEFQVAVLVDRYEYKVERNYGISAVKFHLIPPFDRLKTSSPKPFSRCAIHSCICDGKLAITSQETFVSGSNFDPEMPFRPLT